MLGFPYIGQYCDAQRRFSSFLFSPAWNFLGTPRHTSERTYEDTAPCSGLRNS